MSMLSVDMASVTAMLAEMGDAAEAAARPAAQAAAQVLYDEVKRNVAAIPAKTGRLGQSIYQVYSHANSGEGRATYHVSWNVRKAPHGHLVEFGHIQRYATYIGRDGNFYTAVRPEARGKRKPPRGASQAVKDAYYVPLGSPRQVPAKSFVRTAAVKFPQAAQAAADALHRAIE
jgi:Flp pilus assembly protein TadG